MAIKKASKKAAKKPAAKKKMAAKPAKAKVAAKKYTGVITGIDPNCQPCTWGFEAELDSSFKARKYKVTVSKMKDEAGAELKWDTGEPVLKFSIKPE
jgi:hypothetical protein